MWPSDVTVPGHRVLPERAEQLFCSTSDVPQPALEAPSEGALAALGIFDMLIQTVLQGGAHRFQTAQTQTLVIKVSSARDLPSSQVLPSAACGRLDVVLHVGQGDCERLVLPAD